MKETLDYLSGLCYESMEHNADDYISKKDGLLYCGKCHTPKQVKLTFQGEEQVKYCICDCESKKDSDFREQMRQDEIYRIRAHCFPNFEMTKWTFQSDNGKSDRKAFATVKHYADSFGTMLHDGIGLLLYGEVTGTGKSYHAACIANQVIDMGYTAYMTDFDSIINGVWSAQDKNEYINDIVKYDLLIIDDLGVERESPYTNEYRTAIINVRCTSKLPIIVTTNFAPEQLVKTKDMAKQRIYSRLFEMTIPVYCPGVDNRRRIMTENISKYRDLLGL